MNLLKAAHAGYGSFVKQGSHVLSCLAIWEIPDSVRRVQTGFVWCLIFSTERIVENALATVPILFASKPSTRNGSRLNLIQ